MSISKEEAESIDAHLDGMGSSVLFDKGGEGSSYSRVASGEDPNPLFEQWPDLGFLGMGFWWGWIWLCYNGTGLFSWGGAAERTSCVLQMYLLSTVAIAAVMIVAAVKWRAFTRLVDSRLFVMLFGFLASIATLGAAVSVMAGLKVPFFMFCIATGAFTSALCLKTGRLYGGIALGESLTNGALSLILACALYYIGRGIPEQWCPLFIALLPLASATLFCLVRSETFPGSSFDETSGRCATSKERRMFLRLVAASAVVALTAGIGKGFVSSAGSSASFSLEGAIAVFFVGVIAAVIIVLVNKGSVHQGARIAYTTLMVMGIAVMLGTGFGLSMTYLSVGKEALWCVLSCLMAYLAFRFEMSPVRVFGFGQAAYFLSSAFGWAIGAFAYSYAGDSTFRMVLGMLLAFLVVLVMSYIFPEKSIKQIATWRVESDGADFASPNLSDERGVVCGVSAQCAACPLTESGGAMLRASVTDALLVEEDAEIEKEITGIARAADARYGLSQRELEILELFAQGRSANWIADSLVISKNTVRAHLRAIYTKLDIHTRQELLDFLAGK